MKYKITGNGYTPAHFDYTSYPATMHCYGGRSGYYGCSINPVSSNSSLYVSFLNHSGIVTYQGYRYIERSNNRIEIF